MFDFGFAFVEKSPAYYAEMVHRPAWFITFADGTRCRACIWANARQPYTEFAF